MLKKLLLLTTMAISTLAVAQQETKRPCTTHSHEEEYFRQHPEARKSFEEYNQAVMRRANELTQTQQQQGVKSAQAARFIIPVVVHIIQPPGLSSYPWVPDAQVHDMIRIMNEDFMKLNRDTNTVVSPFNQIIGNTGFEFRLATRDPNGNPTNGITRTISSLTSVGDDQVKTLVRWPHSMYYNIWVVENIASGAGAYAYRPGNTNPQNEGVVCRASQFGGIGLACGSNFCDRTMTHETGHFFNLPHTWGGSNTPGLASNCNIDDGIQDTPNTVGVVGQGCPTSMPSCAGDPVSIANVQNYMDYASCGVMFTRGQSNVMITAAQSSRGSRNTLWTQTNLIATGTADPYMWQQVKPRAVNATALQSTCSDGAVIVTGWAERLAKDSTARIEWLTPGAVSPSYTGNPAAIVYNRPGRYNVRMIARNSFGADTTAATFVANILPGDTVFGQPYAEGFEQTGWPNLDPDTNRVWKQYRLAGPTGLSWRRSTVAATGGGASLNLNIFNQAGTTRLESPNISTRALTPNMRLFFKMAYVPRTANYGDQFTVSFSHDCGLSWQTVKTLSRTTTPALATRTGTYTTIGVPWVPAAADWRTETVLISSIRTRPRFKIRFEMATTNGAGFYIDDINMGSAAITDIGDELKPGFMLSVYPNPGTDQSIIAFRTVQDDQVNVSLYNVAGKLIATKPVHTSGGFDTQLTVSELAGQQLPAGVYSIRLSNGNHVHAEKIVIQ